MPEKQQREIVTIQARAERLGDNPGETLDELRGVLASLCRNMRDLEHRIDRIENRERQAARYDIGRQA